MRIAPLLGPTDAGCGRLNGQHLARSCRVSHVRRTTPFVRHQEQRSVVHAPEHASEAAAVKVDRLQHLTAFANAHATLVGDVRTEVRAALQPSSVASLRLCVREKVGFLPPFRLYARKPEQGQT